MQYHFFFVPSPSQFVKQLVQHFAQGDMPIIPAVGDKIEYGNPAIPARVVDREIRFHGASSDNEMHIFLFVEESQPANKFAITDSVAFIELSSVRVGHGHYDPSRPASKSWLRHQTKVLRDVPGSNC